MNLDGHKPTIVHSPDCRCQIVGEAIYVASTCHVTGIKRLSRNRLQQLLHMLKRKRK